MSSKRSSLSKRVKALTLSAMMASLSVVILYLGSIIEVLDLCTALIASIMCTFVVIEVGGGWPYLTYAVTSVLSLLLLPNKFIAVVYFLFAGIYPILKEKIERLSSKILKWAIKIAFFCLIITTVFLISEFILAVPMDINVWVYLLGTPVFVLYDVALTRLITAYVFRYKKMLKIK